MPRLPTLLSDLATNWGDPHDFSGLIIGYYGSQNSNTYIYHLITKDIIKDNDEQQDEDTLNEVHEDPEHTVCGVCHSPGTWMCLPTWMVYTPHSLGTFIGGFII